MSSSPAGEYFVRGISSAKAAVSAGHTAITQETATTMYVRATFSFRISSGVLSDPVSMLQS